ncbi:Transcription factor STP1 [Cyberlindnera fabianii]|uniref:Transcription factor STP1 n=1 Tax=Cyberlindnera fabianii TaxID=36022 RepID=A0A1V2L0S8_CYBFA|nr:Transcription factor STP1 [Cyberlindnera fabianii]
MANTEKESSSIMGIFTGVLNYIKGGFKFLEPVLPKKQNTSQMPSKSITSTTDMKTHKQQDDSDNDDADHDDHDDHDDDDDDHSLFPKKIIIDKEAFKGSSAVACSTNKPSKLVKVEHLDGSVAWSFDHNETGATVGNMTSMSNMTSPFLTSTGSTVSGGFSPMINMNIGYLTRHIKKHALNKAYECPFFDEHSENKCHPNGGFSRRDTYKTHLKARHFKYPPGTRSQDRAITAGKCGLCNKPYESNEDWVERHIEGGECEALPKGYTGRVKNSRRKNYEYPNPQQISPISSNSGNDSPMTSKSSPHTLVMPQNGGGSMSHHHLPMQDSISGNIHIGVANMTPGSIGTPIHSRPGSAEGGSTVMNNNTNNTTTTDHIEMKSIQI